MGQIDIITSRRPTIAVVGRPNVGKSTLFNRMIGKRKAVVLDTPGITRDRNFDLAEWAGRRFQLIDTGGYETEARDATFEQMREQSLVAVREADVVVFITDVHEDGNPVDEDVAEILRRSGKPIVVGVNKCDSIKLETEALAFHSLGFGDLFAISAMNGAGVADLFDRAVDLLPEETDADKDDEDWHGIRIAVIGRPNVGKSSLVNKILGRERVIVNDMPGTTRDTIDTTFEVTDDNSGEKKRYTILDTAGLRKRGKIERGVEKLSAISAQANLARAHVALVLIDARDALTDQDGHIAGYAHNEFRGCILCVNKWDLIEKDNTTAGQFAKDLRDEMGFFNYAPIIMISAMTGQRTHKLLDMVDNVYAEASKKIETHVLNEWLKDVLMHQSPPWRKGKQLRIKYVTQTGSRPPEFTFFVNNPNNIHFSYERFLINQLRKAFGFEGTPIRLKWRRKSKARGSGESNRD